MNDLIEIGPRFKKNRRSWSSFQCKCGKIIRRSLNAVSSGNTKSCGCRLRKHGMYGTPVYESWVSMMTRCNNPNSDSWCDYGGRGITVCLEWEDFRGFYQDMGDRPSSVYTLERLDNEGPYRKSNCKWATARTQANNRRSNVRLDLGGRNLTLSEWSRETGISKGVLQYRKSHGWSDEECLFGRTA